MYFSTFALAALSISSVFAVPATEARDPKVLTSAISAVASSKANVDSQVVIINNFVQTTVNQAAIPALKATINNIASEISSVTKFVVPLVTDVVLPLAQQELDNVPGLVSNVKDIIADAEYTANCLLASLSQQLLLLVKTEVLLLLATIDPFVQPVEQFAASATVGTSGHSTQLIATTIAAIQDIDAQVLGPITVAYNKLN